MKISPAAIGYGAAFVGFILAGFFAAAAAAEVPWLKEIFAITGVITIFGGAAWLVLIRWKVSDENKFHQGLEKLRRGDTE